MAKISHCGPFSIHVNMSIMRKTLRTTSDGKKSLHISRHKLIFEQKIG